MAPVLSEERDPWKIPQERPRLRRHGSTEQETTRVFFSLIVPILENLASDLSFVQKKKKKGEEKKENDARFPRS